MLTLLQNDRMNHEYPFIEILWDTGHRSGHGTSDGTRDIGRDTGHRTGHGTSDGTRDIGRDTGHRTGHGTSDGTRDIGQDTGHRTGHGTSDRTRDIGQTKALINMDSIQRIYWCRDLARIKSLQQCLLACSYSTLNNNRGKKKRK